MRGAEGGEPATSRRFLDSSLPGLAEREVVRDGRFQDEFVSFQFFSIWVRKQIDYKLFIIVDFKGDKLQFLVSESLPPKNITPHTIFDIGYRHSKVQKTFNFVMLLRKSSISKVPNFKFSLHEPYPPKI